MNWKARLEFRISLQFHARTGWGRESRLCPLPLAHPLLSHHMSLTCTARGLMHMHFVSHIIKLHLHTPL